MKKRIVPILSVILLLFTSITAYAEEVTQDISLDDSYTCDLVENGEYDTSNEDVNTEEINLDDESELKREDAAEEVIIDSAEGDFIEEGSVGSEALFAITPSKDVEFGTIYKVEAGNQEEAKNLAYAMHLPSSGRITVQFHVTDLSYYWNQASLNIKDLSLSTLGNMTVGNNSEQISTFDLVGGDYIINFGTDGAVVGFAGEFKVSFASAEESFADSTLDKHNSSLTAAEVPDLNSTIKGQFALNDDTDVYKLNVGSTTKFKIAYQTTDISSTSISLQSESGKSYLSEFNVKSGTTAFEKKLSTGVYYLTIKNEASKNSTGVYKLILGTGQATGDYKINYVLNGGVNNLENPSSYSIGDQMELLEPTKTGYSFEGWYRDKKFKTPTNGIEATDKGKMTFYAKWTPIQYSITYLEADMSTVTNPPTSYTIAKNVNLKKPKKDGYKFVTWKDENGNSYSKIKKGSYGDIVLTATWTPVTYKISYNLKGGKLDKSAVKKYDIETAVELPVPTKKNHEFGGWYTDKKYSGEAVTVIEIGNYGNKKLYAKWIKQ